MDDGQRTPSRMERAKAERQKILERLNSIDTGAHHHEREQEERRAYGTDVARERERRPEPGSYVGGAGC